MTTEQPSPPPNARIDEETGQPPKSWRSTFRDGAAYISCGVIAGLIGGLIIGGIGGRLAMFVLRLTSDDSLIGLETDDEFIIGSFTSSTFFLILLTTLVGLVGGLLYLMGRDWFPYRWRPVLFGLFCGTFGGTLIINPGGVDFTLLEPLWLAVAMFIALPAIYGVTVSLITERLLRTAEAPEAANTRRAAWRNWAWVGALPLLVILGAGPPGIAIVILVAASIAANRNGRLAELWRSTPVVWVGRALFAASIAVSAYFLADDVTTVL